MTAPDRWTEETARTLVQGWMAHLGYTADRIAEFENDNPHIRAGCDWEDQHWNCLDEDERSLHPEYDEFSDVAEQVTFHLDALADTGLFLPRGGQTRQEWRVASGGEATGSHRSKPAAEASLGRIRRAGWPDAFLEVRTITTWPDGTTLTGPWTAVDGSDG